MTGNRVNSRATGVRILVLGVAVLCLSACMMRDAWHQFAQLESACVISGTVTAEEPGPYVIAALAEALDAADGPVMPVDFFVMDEAGEWVFALQPGRYHLVAFRDLDGSLEYDPVDPLIEYRDGEGLECPAGSRLEGIELVMDVGARVDAFRAITLSRVRDGEERSRASLGQATAFGEVTTLDDARFAMEIARDSLWRPVDFLLAGFAGIYFLEPYDPYRVPVLFVHGINGSPRVFDQLIKNLDTARFQPWLYYYPSGLGLRETSDYLSHLMLELELRHGVDEVIVVAHSMGGLVAHSFLQRRKRRGAPARVPLFIPISTPWGGHAAAGRAAGSSPLVLPVWKDMAPDSEFLTALFDPQENDLKLPPETVTHMLFSYRGGDGLTWGTSDGVISLASLLRDQAQRSAASVHGYNTSHIGILSDPDAVRDVHRLMAEAIED